MVKKYSSFFDEFLEKFAIDRRFVFFDYKIDTKRKKDHISVKVSDKKYYKLLKKLFSVYFDDLQNKAVFNIKLVPEKNIPFKYGICNSGFVPVYSQPKNQSEILTQILLGETCSILEITEKWYLVRLHHDGYIGWVSNTSVLPLKDKEYLVWNTLPKITISNISAEIYSQDKEKIERIGFIGNQLPVLSEYKKWIGVQLPDQNSGWIKKESVTKDLSTEKPNAKKIIQTAKKFLGVPYLWGGRSPFGIDCSGFVQLVFGLNGIELPRDASLQYKTGTDLGKNFKNFKTCDLLFFGENSKITHVGIYLEKEKQFIHSSGFVQCASLDKNEKNYDKRLDEIFIGAKRITIK